MNQHTAHQLCRKSKDNVFTGIPRLTNRVPRGLNSPNCVSSGRGGITFMARPHAGGEKMQQRQQCRVVGAIRLRAETLHRATNFPKLHKCRLNPGNARRVSVNGEHGAGLRGLALR